MIDTTTPNAPGVSGGGATYAISRSFTLTAPTNSPSGIKEYEYYISNSTAKPDKTITATSTSKSTDIRITNNGKYIYFRAVNNVGTKGEWTTYQNLFVETTYTMADSCEIKNVTATGYDIYVYGVRSPNGISAVQFPTWTIYGGQDDLSDWGNGELVENNTWKFHVDIALHNNEAGSYMTHIYLLDKKNESTMLKTIPYHMITNNYVADLYLTNEKDSIFKNDKEYIISSTPLYNNFTLEFDAKPDVTTTVSPAGTYMSLTNNNILVLEIFTDDGSNTAGIGLAIGTNGAVAIAHAPSYYYALLSYTGNLAEQHRYRFTVKDNIPYLYIDGNLVATGISPLPPIKALRIYAQIGTGTYGKFSGTANNFVLYNTAR